MVKRLFAPYKKLSELGFLGFLVIKKLSELGFLGF